MKERITITIESEYKRALQAKFKGSTKSSLSGIIEGCIFAILKNPRLYWQIKAKIANAELAHALEIIKIIDEHELSEKEKVEFSKGKLMVLQEVDNDAGND